VIQSVEAHPQPLQPHHSLCEALTSLRCQRPVRIGEGSTAGNSNAVTNQEEFHGGPQGCAPVLRTASCPAILAGPIAVRSTQFGAGERVVFTGDIVPKTLMLLLKRST